MPVSRNPVSPNANHNRNLNPNSNHNPTVTLIHYPNPNPNPNLNPTVTFLWNGILRNGNPSFFWRTIVLWRRNRFIHNFNIRCSYVMLQEKCTIDGTTVEISNGDRHWEHSLRAKLCYPFWFMSRFIVWGFFHVTCHLGRRWRTQHRAETLNRCCILSVNIPMWNLCHRLCTITESVASYLLCEYLRLLCRQQVMRQHHCAIRDVSQLVQRREFLMKSVFFVEKLNIWESRIRGNSWYSAERCVLMKESESMHSALRMNISLALSDVTNWLQLKRNITKVVTVSASVALRKNHRSRLK